jgi:hypothetical protein
MTKKITQEQTRLTRLLKGYSDKVGLDADQDKVSESYGEKLFKVIIQDYVVGIISVDDLSSLCEMFYSKLDIKTELYSLLLMGAEVEWYIRHRPPLAASAIENLVRKFSRESLEVD